MKELDLEHKIALSIMPNLGLSRLKQLIAYCGDPAKLFTLSQKQYEKIPEIGKGVAKSIVDNREKVLHQAKEELKFVRDNDLVVHTYWDQGYPSRLKFCHDAPIVIYTKGSYKFGSQKRIGIVGTRKPTALGRSLVESIVTQFKQKGVDVTIVSGLAYGIDIEAHKAAIKNGLSTIAALGHHLGTVYPSRHKDVAQKVCQNGVLISEYRSDSPFHSTNFAQRNRIVAGISDALLVVESAERGGSLITAEYANNYNRDVFAIPGRPNDKQSTGCNALIKTNRAILAESADDIIYAMQWGQSPSKDPVQRQLFVELPEDQQAIFDLLTKAESLSVDEMSAELNMNTSRISSLLFEMEIQGLLAVLPGNCFQIIK